MVNYYAGGHAGFGGGFGRGFSGIRWDMGQVLGMVHIGRGIFHQGAEFVGEVGGVSHTVNTGYQRQRYFGNGYEAAGNRAEVGQIVTGEQLEDFRAWQHARAEARAHGGTPVAGGPAPQGGQPQPGTWTQPGNGQTAQTQQQAPAITIPAGSGAEAHSYGGAWVPKNLKQNQVHKLQELLHVDTDEKWGPKTEAAFKTAAARAGFSDPTQFDFSNPEDLKKLQVVLTPQRTSEVAPQAPAQTVGVYTAFAPADQYVPPAFAGLSAQDQRALIAARTQALNQPLPDDGTVVGQLATPQVPDARPQQVAQGRGGEGGSRA